jgi:hypothetical protein
MRKPSHASLAITAGHLRGFWFSSLRRAEAGRSPEEPMTPNP